MCCICIFTQLFEFIQFELHFLCIFIIFHEPFNFTWELFHFCHIRLTLLLKSFHFASQRFGCKLDRSLLRIFHFIWVTHYVNFQPAQFTKAQSNTHNAIRNDIDSVTMRFWTQQHSTANGGHCSSRSPPISPNNCRSRQTKHAQHKPKQTVPNGQNGSLSKLCSTSNNYTEGSTNIPILMAVMRCCHFRVTPLLQSIMCLIPGVRRRVPCCIVRSVQNIEIQAIRATLNPVVFLDYFCLLNIASVFL